MAVDGQLYSNWCGLATWPRLYTFGQIVSTHDLSVGFEARPGRLRLATETHLLTLWLQLAKLPIMHKVGFLYCKHLKGLALQHRKVWYTVWHQQALQVFWGGGKLMPKHPEVIATGLTVARVMAARDNIIRSVLDDSLHTFQCVWVIKIMDTM